MQKSQTITITEYLVKKSIPFQERNGELVAHCLFNGCDRDSHGQEAHLYFHAGTGKYHCKKCGAKGNIKTLATHFGDSFDEIYLKPDKGAPVQNKKPACRFNADLVEKCHSALPEAIRRYLNDRGITDEMISKYKLGWGKFYGGWWITIPIQDAHGNYVFFKLRQDPFTGNRKITFPKREDSGAGAQIYSWDTFKTVTDTLIICEGEMDCLLLVSEGIPAITSTHGAMTFNKEWALNIPNGIKLYLCFDNDDTGRKAARRIAEMLKESGHTEIYIITLPPEVGEHGDVTDYFMRLKGSPQDLLNQYAREYPEKIDVSKFKPLSIQELANILELTIKRDEVNKTVTFLCELSVYTEDGQFNISFNAPSSTGKSYIPTEVASLFPDEDVLELAHCSPTAFFHDTGEYNRERNCYVVDLSQKILIFLDQPHNELLARLRPLLSHDRKEICLKIADKTQKFGLRTKNVLLRGFPVVIFCTAGLRIDEQEATRFLLLSPEINQGKIRLSIYEAIIKESNKDEYRHWLEKNNERRLLKERIRAIKLEKIQDVKIYEPQKIERRFMERHRVLKPRHQRDVKRVISLVKALALLNLWWREREGSCIIAKDEDIVQAFQLWDKISESQELNLPPYVYGLYRDVILTAYKEKNDGTALGLTKQEVHQKHFKVYNRHVPDWQLRQHIFPMLETAGLITMDKDPKDKRVVLIHPTVPLTISEGQEGEERNSETTGW